VNAGPTIPVSVDARTFRDLLADPNAAETLSAATGCPLVVVEIHSAAEGGLLACLDIAIPAVVVVLSPDAGWLPAAAFETADVVLTDADDPQAPFVRPTGGAAGGVSAITAALGRNPVAGTTLALLLRGTGALDVSAGLVAESAAYSALQEGAEFHRWRAARPMRPAEPEAARVRIERSKGELRIVLARPARRNAVDLRMRDALVEALAQAAAEPGIRVVLDADGPDFCAGGDLDEFGSRPDPAIAHLARLTRSPARLLHRLSARTTAYLHGACLGAGIELPAFAARVHAAEDARIGLPEISLGLMPGAGGTVSLPLRIGRWRTAFLALTGEPVDARTALQWGLVDTIEPAAGR
jgi:enoyl-CoA hydratase/carnithine racemase